MKHLVLGLLMATTFSGSLAAADALIGRVSALSQGYTTYIGEDINNLSIFQDGQFLGEESFENRYGTHPTVTNTVVSQPLTEPFILAHNNPTPFVFIYLHGITDSAFQGKDLARSLYNSGQNVLVTRLSGHGVDVVNINQIKVADWQNDVDKAIERAKLLGQKVVLMGLSTGGALTIDRAYRAPQDVAALVAIAPAIGIADRLLNLLEKVDLVQPLSHVLPYVGTTKTDEVEVRQVRKNTHALHVLYELGKSVQARMNQPIGIPAVVVTSDADVAIDMSVIPKLVSDLTHSQWLKLHGQEHGSLAFDPKYVAYPFYSEAEAQPPILPFGSLSDANTQYDEVVKAIVNLVGLD